MSENTTTPAPKFDARRAARTILWDLYRGDKERAIALVKETRRIIGERGELTPERWAQLDMLIEAIEAADPDHA